MDDMEGWWLMNKFFRPDAVLNDDEFRQLLRWVLALPDDDEDDEKEDDELDYGISVEP